ncbi:MAG: di-heme enzyme [Myxococcales bacterium]|nr:di-heme enzyme [Myxococcales bacterium]
MKAALLCLGLAVGCTTQEGSTAIEIDLDLPQHFPEPVAPESNPLTAASVELGRHLFYDTRLSVNDTLACASCHKQESAFADDRALSLGATGTEGVLNAPSLGNAIYARPLTWAHGDITAIEDQLVGPMYGESPIEMGMTGSEDEILDRIREDSLYNDLFAEAYPDEPLSLELAKQALASFVRSLISYRAPFDDFVAGNPGAISQSAQRGSELFYSEKLGCSHCHAGFAFTTAVASSSTNTQPTSPFHNIGLYNVDGRGAYPAAAQGLISESGFERDMGRFRVPSLRNVALTAPYGHDGSVASLEAFIRIYEAGGRNVEGGSYAGDGRENPWRSIHLRRFELSDEERGDLVAFLESLSDQDFASDPRLAGPW